MSHRSCTAAGVLMALAAAGAGWAEDERISIDPGGDAVVRRTDPGVDDQIDPGSTLPDLIEVRTAGWQPLSPVTDPYTGSLVVGQDAHILRVQVTLAGLVNPPGPLGHGAAWDFDPFRFGPSPIYGFIEFDADRDRDTGGELGQIAAQRYLAVAARFGETPYDSIASRAARSGTPGDVDDDFFTPPQYERSGIEFLISLCGCFDVTVVSETGNGNGVFEAGETMIVRSRFFQRAAGYRLASGVVGGSDFGLYDPWTDLRFSHDVSADTTTITLVFALDETGASMLTGEPVQPIDKIIDIGGNHASVREAIQDVIDGAEGGNGGPLSGPTQVLAGAWAGESWDEATDPTRWRAYALVGTAYVADGGYPYVWTDVGFDEGQHDYDGDRVVGPLDTAAFDAALAELDGGPFDDDGVVNGSVAITNFGPNYSVFDTDGDGVIEASDRPGAAPCLADFNGDGTVDTSDFFEFFAAFFGVPPDADVNGDGVTNTADFFEFVAAFFSPCP